MLSFGDVTLTMQGWIRSFGFLVILPSLPLMYFYRFMELFWRELSNDTDEGIVLSEEYEWARSIVEYTRTQFFRTTSWIGNITRAGTARFFSYYWTPIALLTFPGIMEVIVPSNIFPLIIFPIIVCIFLLLASGLRNLLSMLKQKSRSYVVRWTPDSEVLKETKEENGTEYNFRQASYSVFVNLFIAYVIFLSGVFAIDRIPVSVIVEIDRVVLSVSQNILIVLLTVAGLPASLVETTWEIIVNTRHPGVALLFILLVAIICLPLYVVAKNSQQIMEKMICLLLDRFNPYDKSPDSYEVVKSFKRDLLITYILFSVVPLVYLVLLLFIVSMLDAVF